MITDEYKQQIRQTREGWQDWGSSASRNCSALLRYLNRDKNIHTVLDFGCGTQSFAEFIKGAQKGGILRPDIQIIGYDPSVPGLDRLPDDRFDLIHSTDVMEHIEPEMLDETIAWQRSHAWRQFHHIDCNATNDRLPDGRDVHLIVEPPEFWLDKYTDDKNWLVMEWHTHGRRRRKVFPRTSTTIITEYNP